MELSHELAVSIIEAATVRDAFGLALRRICDHAGWAAGMAWMPNIEGSDLELKAARDQQAATAEILKIIASSPSDVQPVFEAIASSANRLVGGGAAGVYRFIDGLVHLVAFSTTNPAGDAALRALFPRPIELPVPVGMILAPFHDPNAFAARDAA